MLPIVKMQWIAIAVFLTSMSCLVGCTSQIERRDGDLDTAVGVPDAEASDSDGGVSGPEAGETLPLCDAYDFSCLDSFCVILSQAGQASPATAIETLDPSGRLWATYQPQGAAFRPASLDEVTWLTSSDGLRVRCTSGGSSQELLVHRPVVEALTTPFGTTPNKLWVRVSPATQFDAASYNVSFFTLDGASITAVSNLAFYNGSRYLVVDISTLASLPAAITSTGVMIAVGPTGGAPFFGRYFVHSLARGTHIPFYRQTQVQGNFLGQGLIEIPQYLLSSAIDFPYRRKINESGNPTATEIPWVDRITITRFLGGYRKDWTLFPPDDPVLTYRRADYAYRSSDGQSIQYQRELIGARLDPFIAAGYKPSDLTIGIENIPWDLALNGGTEGEFGNCEPPASWPEWNLLIWDFVAGLKQWAAGRGIDAGMVRFKVGNEYDTKKSYCTIAPNYDQLYYYVERVIKKAANFPDAPIMPGEFTRDGRCDEAPDNAICVYDTPLFVGRAQSNAWKISVLPRSLHGAKSQPTQEWLPSTVADRAIESYNDPKLAGLPIEIHQFGLLAQTFTDSADCQTGCGYDYGAQGASWELQVLFRLKEAFTSRLRQVAHWGGVDTFPAGNPVAHLLKPTGLLRLLLDHQAGTQVFRLQTQYAAAAPANAELLALAFVRGDDMTIMVSTFAPTFSTTDRAVIVRMPKALRDRLAQQFNDNKVGVIRYNQYNNLWAQVRADLQAANNLKAIFAQNPGALARFREMAQDGIAALQMMIARHSTYEAITQGNLTYKAPTSETMLADGVRVTMKQNAILLLGVR